MDFFFPGGIVQDANAGFIDLGGIRVQEEGEASQSMREETAWIACCSICFQNRPKARAAFPNSPMNDPRGAWLSSGSRPQLSQDSWAKPKVCQLGEWLEGACDAKRGLSLPIRIQSSISWFIYDLLYCYLLMLRFIRDVSVLWIHPRLSHWKLQKCPGISTAPSGWATNNSPYLPLSLPGLGGKTSVTRWK